MRSVGKLAIPTLALSLLISACGGRAVERGSGATAPDPPDPVASPQPAPLVRSAVNERLGSRVLVDSDGLTLYHLSGEAPRKLICTSPVCLQVWHPLAATTRHAANGGVRSLGTVKRPDGTTQVTYKGMPLYTFAKDDAPGQANGEGIKDLGRWTAVTGGTGRIMPPPGASSVIADGGNAY
jgi:predicted lipoprotein with Yx(FWY)xxD motif